MVQGAKKWLIALTPDDNPPVPIIQVKAKPNARTSQLVREPDGTYLAQIKASPVDGKANAELVSLVAKYFKVAKSSVVIKTGASARMKLVSLPDSAAEQT